MESSDWVAVAAVVLTLVSWLDNRRAIRHEQRDREASTELLRRQIRGEGAANLIAEHPPAIGPYGDTSDALVSFSIRNAGRAVARDISVEVIQYGVRHPTAGWVLAEGTIPIALAHGERYNGSLLIPQDLRGSVPWIAPPTPGATLASPLASRGHHQAADERVNRGGGPRRSVISSSHLEQTQDWKPLRLRDRIRANPRDPHINPL